MSDSMMPKAQVFTGFVIGLSLGTQRIAYCVLDMGRAGALRAKPALVTEDVNKIGRAPATDREDAAKRLYGHGTLLAVIYGRYPPDCVVVGTPSEQPALDRGACSELFRGVPTGNIIWAQEPRVLEVLDRLRDNSLAGLQRTLASKLSGYQWHRTALCVHAAAADCAAAEHMRMVRGQEP